MINQQLKAKQVKSVALKCHHRAPLTNENFVKQHFQTTLQILYLSESKYFQGSLSSGPKTQ